MTGNTTTVLIGLGLVALVLPFGLLVLARANTTIERQHPFDLGALPPPPASAAIPGSVEIPDQRPAVADEATERTDQGSATRSTAAAGG